MQHNGAVKPTRVLSKFGKLVPPPGHGTVVAVKRTLPKIASLYRCAGTALRPGLGMCQLLVLQSCTGRVYWLKGLLQLLGGGCCIALLLLIPPCLPLDIRNRTCAIGGMWDGPCSDCCPALFRRGVVGAASGAGIAIGAYFAFYGAATNLLVRHSELKTGQIAFVAGAAAAAGGSVVKVPLAVCIRRVSCHARQWKLAETRPQLFAHLIAPHPPPPAPSPRSPFLSVCIRCDSLLELAAAAVSNDAIFPGLFFCGLDGCCSCTFARL